MNDLLRAAVATATGWQAELELVVVRRDAQSVLGKNLHRGPLRVQKVLYPEGPLTCHLVVLHPPGGIAAGDSLVLRTVLGERTAAVLTTPGATKWYRSEGSWARQRMLCSVAAGAVLEWLPRENIFFDGCQAALELEVDLAPGATFFGWDIFGFGRRASGESWSRGVLRLATSIRSGGRLIWSERGHLEAHSGFAASAIGLAGASVCGTFLVAGPDVDAALVTACRESPAVAAPARCGITRVPNVLVARYLGHSTEDAFRWFKDLWTVLRPAVVQKAGYTPRVWAC